MGVGVIEWSVFVKKRGKYEAQVRRAVEIILVSLCHGNQ